MEAIIGRISWLDDFTWGTSMITLLLGIHLFMAVRTSFIQRKAFTGTLLSVRRDPDAPGDVSQFQALATALAFTIDMGSTIGVSTAIFLGGPGAVFWCWLIGVFRITIEYAESLITVKHRVHTPDRRIQDGAMYALERRPNLEWLGVFFAALAALASFNVGRGIQISTIAEVIENDIPVGIPPIAISVAGGLFTGVVIIDGIQFIASVYERLVPFMAAPYVLRCTVILAINWDFLAPVVSTILRLAFAPDAAAGGLAEQRLMTTMRFDAARGPFSDESGMGSVPLVASVAQTRNPVRRALVSTTGTFWDTVVVCPTTGLVLVTTIMKNPTIDMAQISDGGQLTILAFAQIPVLGPVALLVGVITFIWSTILGWPYYGERYAQYLWDRRALLPYKLVFAAVAVVDPMLALDLVWTIVDILNALMAVPNLVTVLLLDGVVARETRHYLGSLDEVNQTETPHIDR